MSDYYEGKGCKCFARSESECSCEGVDWTPKEVYTLRKRIAELENHKNYYQDFLKENTDCESITELVGKYKKQSQRIVEIKQQVAHEMRQKDKAREQRDKVTKRIAELELSEKVLFEMLREFWTKDFYPLERVYDERLDKYQGDLK